MGYRFWEKWINDKGGLLGRPVRFIIYDDMDDPARSQTLVEKLITVDKVDFIMGGIGSNKVFPQSTVTEKHEMVYVEGGGNAARIFERGYTYIFLTFASLANDLPLCLLKELDDYQGVKPNIGVLNQASLFPMSIAEGAIAHAEELGFPVVYHEEFQQEVTDMNAVILAMQAADVEIPIIAGPFSAHALFARTCKELDWTPKLIYSAAQAALPEYGDAMAEDVVYMTGDSQFEALAPYPVVDEFVEYFKDMYGVTPAYQGASAFSACQVVQAAVEALGYVEETPQDETRDWIRNNPVVTVCGPKDYDEAGLPEFSALLIQWQETDEGLQRIIIWPREAATGELIYPMPAWKER